MSKPKWWTDTYDKMTSPHDRLGYLVGLSELSWDDCCDAHLESVKLLPKIYDHITALESRCEKYKAALEYYASQSAWMPDDRHPANYYYGRIIDDCEPILKGLQFGGKRARTALKEEDKDAD